METAEKLIAERSYASLNAEEKASIADLCANEHEFNQMKQFFIGIGAVAEASFYEPSASLKSSLDSVFAAKHGGIGANLTPREPVSVPEAAKIIPMYRQSWFRGAAAVVLLAGAFTIWKVASPDDLKIDNESQQLAKADIPKPDETVVREDNVTTTQREKSENKAVASTGKKEESSYSEDFNAAYSVPAFRTIAQPSFSDDTEQVFAGFTASPEIGDVLKADSYTFSATTKGVVADLNPEGYAGSKLYESLDQKTSLSAWKNKSLDETAALSVSESDENILGMIVPAF